MHNSLFDWIHSNAEHIPFLMAAAPNGSGKISINLSAIFQALIIAVLIWLMLGLSITPRLDHMRTDIEKNGESIEQLYNKLFQPVNYQQ